MIKGVNKNKYVIIALTFLILILSIINLDLSLIKSEIIERNTFDSENAVYISFEEYDSRNIMKVLNEFTKEKELIIKNVNDFSSDVKAMQSGNTIGIYFDSKYNKEFSMKNGRFINDEDIREKNKVAVVGDRMESYLREDDGKKYLSFFGTDYEVIGIIEGNEKINNTDYIFYNLAPFIEDEKNMVKDNWILDSESLSKSEIIDIVEKIQDKNKDVKILITESTIELTSDMAKFMIMDTLVILNLCLFAIILSLVRSIIMWINNMRVEIGVRFACGETKLGLIKHLAFEYLKIIIISSIISSIILVLMSLFKGSLFLLVQFDISIIIKGLIIGMIVGVLTIPLLSIKFKSMNSSILMKGGL